MAFIEDEDIGSLEITATARGINCCMFSSLGSFEKGLLAQQDCLDANAALILSQALSQINAYLRGKLTVFTIPLDWSNISSFARRVYEATMQIPFGEVRTYGEIAAVIGQAGAARAVGGALRANPFVLLVPCHRVVGGNRHLHGFSAPGGLATKSWLLRHEGHSIQENRLS
ncbi:MAG: Methylated-DNA--protein-cysteine methyltransferase [Anaerolinea thermophila]|uniref:methylated-DNA--[protein]-cysteine S-methyltransferase n=1 Tax=Anaerolinea thermophila TaxID=167964 RepID=A0A101FY00_9CHLR|nr:MAG: Methylated-DNA--protein-cysteine methyltransferase [Anaerolinea thermophila]